MNLTDQIKHFAAQTTMFVKQKIQGTRTSRVVSFTALFFAMCAVGAVGVAPLAPDASDLPVKTITQELEVPALDEQIASQGTDNAVFIREEKVQRGDTLATLLHRLGIDDVAAHQYIRSDELAKNILLIKPGKSIRAKSNQLGGLEWLQVALQDGTDKPTKTLTIERNSKGEFVSSEEPIKLERRLEMRSGEIYTSLFVATDVAQIPSSIEDQMIKMFETNVDFRRLQRGDYFNVVYESFWHNGEMVKAGRLLSGEFSSSSKLFQAVWFDEGANEGGYYSFDGKSLKKAFLKSPLEFSRVSSGFSMRVHPISGKWKRHTGIDFAAATGTPIRASADGVIDFAGVQGGYGNLVSIKHWSNYSTAYAHMSRFASGIKKGVRVSQGQVIGYVGSTGWSTGPHLHYEFRVGNEPRDPNSINVQSPAQLTAQELQRFRLVASEMAHRFALLRPAKNTNQLASR
jgi:murein DD-endopeptidase MepM/ murein hydrolase activator NlpD